MNDYIMLIRGDRSGAPSPEQLQQRLEAYRAWVDRVTADASYVEGIRLQRTGATLTPEGALVTDGPFVEAKELIAGIVRIRAADLAGAIAIARSCPLHQHFEIEIRPTQEDA